MFPRENSVCISFWSYSGMQPVVASYISLTILEGSYKSQSSSLYNILNGSLTYLLNYFALFSLNIFLSTSYCVSNSCTLYSSLSVTTFLTYKIAACKLILHNLIFIIKIGHWMIRDLEMNNNRDKYF